MRTYKVVSAATNREPLYVIAEGFTSQDGVLLFWIGGTNVFAVNSSCWVHVQVEEDE